MQFICHMYLLVYHLYVTRMCSYVICMSLVCTRMECYVTYIYSYIMVCHSYGLVVIRMSLVCFRMSSVCHSYVVLPRTDSKWPWQVIKEITGKQKTKSNFLLWEIKVDKTIIQNPQDIAEELIDYLLVLDQNWRQKSRTLEKHFKTF